MSMPTLTELSLSLVGETAMDPWVLEIDVIVIEADSDYVMAILEVLLIGCMVIFIFPGLNEDYHWSTNR